MAIHGREKTKTFSFFGSIVREAKTTVTVKNYLKA